MRVLARRLTERTVLGNERQCLAPGFGMRREAVCSQRVGHRRDRSFHRTMTFTRFHSRRDRTAILVSHLLGEGVRLVLRQTFERACEQRAQEVVAARWEQQVRVVRDRAVPLGWTARRLMSSQLDLEVAAGGEFLEMVAGDVRMELEAFGDLGRPHARGMLPCEEVDVAARRVSECARDGGHGRGELLGSEFCGCRHARYSTYAHSGNVRRLFMPQQAPTEAAILDALRPVEDPEIRRSIVDLDMVRGIEIDGSNVRVTVALTVAGCPLRSEITRRVTDAVIAVGGVSAVDVDLTVMTDEQRAALTQQLHGGHDHDTRTNPFTDSRTRVIAISSGKGGVGKSSVTTNLAVALAQRGHRVAAIDADVWGFSMPRMLGIDRPPTVIDDVIVPPDANGVTLISMGFFAREDQPVVWRGPMLHKALEQFLTDVHWGEPDFLVVDMPPGTGDVALSMAQFLPRAEVLVVTTPQPAAQKVAQRAAYMARKVNLQVTGVIENMSWFRCDHDTRYTLFGEGGGQELADQLDVPLLGQVPLVPALRAGGDEGRPIVAAEPDSEAAVAFRSIAERVDVELAPTRIYRTELKII